jgi:general secretion pathway protein K
MKSSQRGAALIIVLLIFALASVIATQMTGRLQLQVQRASNIKQANQAYWYAMGAEQFARKSITTLFESNEETINLSQDWASEALNFPLPGGGIEASIVDMQSCFNINALRVEDDDEEEGQALKDAFLRILQNVEVEIPSLNAETLTDSLVDWLDTNSIPSGSFGAEDSEYRSRPQPYLAANSLMAHKSELRLVNGVEPRWLREVLPLFCAIPDNNAMRINVNTLTDDDAVILQALLNLSSLSDAQDRITSRPEGGYEDIADFLQEPEIAALNLSEAQQAWFDVSTNYFLLHTKTHYNDSSFNMTSVLRVDTNNNVTVLRREFGGIE